MVRGAAAAARDGFQNQRIADLLGFFLELLLVFDDAVAAGNRGHAGGFHFAPGAILFAHNFDDFGARSDESNLRSFANFGEIRIL